MTGGEVLKRWFDGLSADQQGLVAEIVSREIGRYGRFLPAVGELRSGMYLGPDPTPKPPPSNVCPTCGQPRR